jgi:magnesium transporter
MRLGTLLGPELKELLREDPDQVRELVEELHAEDLADIIS